MKSHIIFAAVLVALLLPPTAFAQGKTPPPVEDIVGVYTAKVKAQIYDGDVFFKASDTTLIEIEQVGPDTVNVWIQLTGGIYRGYYDNGMLVIARGDDEELASWTDAAFLQFSGTPGKIKAKGVFRRYSLYDYIENLTLSVKQTTK